MTPSSRVTFQTIVDHIAPLKRPYTDPFDWVLSGRLTGRDRVRGCARVEKNAVAR